MRAKKLKAAGLIDIDLRLKMTPAQKAAVTRKYNQCRDIVNHPENYEKISVSPKTAKTADWDIARKATAKKVSLWIPKEDNGAAKIKRERVAGKILPVLILDYPTHTEKVYPGGFRFFEVAEKVFTKEHDPRHWITARIGENASFKTARFDDRAALMNYLQAWQPKDARWKDRKHELIKHFSVVTLKYHKNPFNDLSPCKICGNTSRKQINGICIKCRKAGATNGKKEKGRSHRRSNRR